MPADATRPRGRPRTRPEGVRECPVYLTPEEIAAVDQRAASDGISRAEWLRRTALAAAGISGNPRRKK